MLYNTEWDKKLNELKIDPVSKILLDAADIIEREGWIKNSYHNSNGYCVAGAMIKAAGSGNLRDLARDPNFMTAHNRVTKIIGMIPIPFWNDGVPGFARPAPIQRACDPRSSASCGHDLMAGPYRISGALFAKTSPNGPMYAGVIEIDGVKHNIALWEKTSAKRS